MPKTLVMITVAPGSASGSQSGSSAGSGSSAVSGSGSRTASCIVPKYAGATYLQVKKRNIAGHCGLGKIRRVKTTKVKRGRVLGLTAGAGAGKSVKRGVHLEQGTRAA